MFLYHSTFRANLSSIKKLGLGAKQSKNWDISKTGVVYFATDAEVANSFCEAAENVSDYKYDSGIIVLAVDSKYLDNSRVYKDKNILDPNSVTYAYKGIIPPQYLLVVRSGKGIVGRLLDFKRVQSFE